MRMSAVGSHVRVKREGIAGSKDLLDAQEPSMKAWRALNAKSRVERVRKGRAAGMRLSFWRRR
jgi:hypothetical protein